MLGEFGHAVSLGEVLSDEAVGVLVGTSFPGMMGISEVESGVGEALDVLIAVEFGSVVGGDGTYGAGLTLDQSGGPLAQLLCGACLELADLEVSCLAFHEGYDAVLAMAEHGVNLPVSDAGSVVGGGVSVLDGPLASQSSPGVVGAVSLASLLGCTPQVSMKGAAPALVVPDVPIDGLMADLEPPVERQSSGDLLGAPILHPDQELDESPIPIGESEVPSGMRSPGASVSMRLQGPVESVSPSAIASDLSMDRASMPPQGLCDFSHGYLFSSEHPNGVSFFTGDLVIRQRSLPSFSRVKETTVSQIALCRT